VLEFLFSATHGTVLGYESDGSTIRAILHGDLPSSHRTRCVSALQNGALDYVGRQLQAGTFGLPPQVAFRRLFRVLTAPTSREARLLGDVGHRDGFGDSSASLPFAPALTRRELCNPLLFVRAWQRAYWKSGFIVRNVSAWFGMQR